jgi:hypothetical protein
MFELFNEIECKHCKKTTRFGEVMLLHLIFKEKIKPTKRDIIFLMKHFILCQVIAFVLNVLYCLIGLIIYPFWWIGDYFFGFYL